MVRAWKPRAVPQTRAFPRPAPQHITVHATSLAQSSHRKEGTHRCGPNPHPHPCPCIHMTDMHLRTHAFTRAARAAPTSAGAGTSKSLPPRPRHATDLVVARRVNTTITHQVHTEARCPWRAPSHTDRAHTPPARVPVSASQSQRNLGAHNSPRRHTRRRSPRAVDTRSPRITRTRHAPRTTHHAR